MSHHVGLHAGSTVSGLNARFRVDAAKHYVFAEPASLRVCRYTPLRDFERMLRESAVSLTNLRKYDENFFESTCPRANFEARQPWVNALAADGSIRSEDETVVRMMDHNIAAFMRKITFVSCWNVEPNESHELWRRFCPSGDGVCLESTVGRVRTALPPHICLARVRYIDIERERTRSWSQFEYPVTKPAERFAVENELRALHFDWEARDREPEFHSEPVDLRVLIESVRAQPGCTDELIERVRAIGAAHSLGVPINRSSLDGIREPG